MVAAQTTTAGSTTSSPVAPPKRVAALIAVLGALTAVAPLSTDMYVPGFPEMGSSLHASASAVQLSMTAFLAGAVLGQILIGPLSDGLGRRRLLIPGTAAFAALSFLCAVAPNVQVLIGARFLEGVAGAVGMVLARAVITDWFHGADIPRYFSMLSMVLGIAPVAAPVIGGAILSVSTWRATFFVLTAAGVLLLLAVLAKVPESLPPARRRAVGLGSTFRAMGRLLGRRTFVGYVLTLGFSTAALFTYISGSSFVFENIYGVSATQYSLIFAVNALGMLLAGGAFGVLARRLRMNTLLTLGVSVAAAGVIGQVVLIATVGGSLAGTWCCLFVALAGIGMVFPASMSLGQTLGRHAPGTASALLGGTQFLLGALASPLVGLFGTSSATPMAAIMLGALACAALSLTLLARPWQGHGEFRESPHTVAAA
ncbi:MAG: transporter, family, multidrug resistance protein [Streptomyces sp.]|jgi:DHA1 family bicyclomycin/chloramphenicol resistance-like MFS transporter|nr:transporter, family, multidrug resistance protein [Streptomyces sp.]